MSEIIRETKPKARKSYCCDGKEQINKWIEAESPDEFERARKQMQNCKGIKKGDIYISQFNKDGSDVWMWKSCLGCNDIIIKYEFHDF